MYEIAKELIKKKAEHRIINNNRLKFIHFDITSNNFLILKCWSLNLYYVLIAVLYRYYHYPIILGTYYYLCHFIVKKENI